MTPTPGTAPAAVICPLCHIEAPFAIGESLASGGYWRCPRCQQNWSARRLRTVATYADWCRASTAGMIARTGATGLGA